MARMELPVLERFCFIMDLRDGCYVMGILHAIMTLAMAAILITFAVDVREAEARRDDGDSGIYTVIYTIVVLMVVLLFFKFLLNFGFLYAVYKDKTEIMKKYCIFWMIFLVLLIIGLLKTIFHMSAGHVIAQIVFLATELYHYKFNPGPTKSENIINNIGNDIKTKLQIYQTDGISVLSGFRSIMSS